MVLKMRKSGIKYRIPDDHPFAMVIEVLAKEYTLNKASYQNGNAAELPERNDVKQLWRELGPRHKALLEQVAVRAGGASQADLEAALDVDWQGLRGVHNGLARICERLGIEKPVRVTGYKAMNRLYSMDPTVSHTVRNLAKRDAKP